MVFRDYGKFLKSGEAGVYPAISRKVVSVKINPSLKGKNVDRFLMKA